MHNSGKTACDHNAKSAPKAGEISLYFAVPAILILCGAFPSVAIIMLPIALPLLYLLYRRLGAYMPLSCVVLYGILSLSLNYDILTVVYCITLFFAFCGLCMCMQLPREQYLLAVTVAVCLGIIGAFVGVGTVRCAEGVPVGDVAAKYVIDNRSDPVIAYYAADYYDNSNDIGTDRLSRDDEGYAAAAAKSLSEWAKDEFDEYTWYYCIHCGAVLAFVGFFIGTALNGKVGGRGRALFASRLGDMKLPRAYLWTMALPATVTGMVLGFVGGYNALSATVMHAFATLPGAFGCYTLLCYFAALFKGKARVAAYIILGIIGIAAVVFPIALFVLAILGVCDSILNIRFWTEYIMTD